MKLWDYKPLSKLHKMFKVFDTLVEANLLLLTI